jgi:hypothetical protein
MSLYQYSLLLREISYAQHECLANPQPNFAKSTFNGSSPHVTLLGICLLRFFPWTPG